MVIQAGRRARDLVEQILTFSRHTDQARRSLVLQPIVKEVLKLMPVRRCPRRSRFASASNRSRPR